LLVGPVRLSGHDAESRCPNGSVPLCPGQVPVLSDWIGLRFKFGPNPSIYLNIQFRSCGLAALKSDNGEEGKTALGSATASWAVCDENHLFLLL
jgi:hypothetical protein